MIAPGIFIVSLPASGCCAIISSQVPETSTQTRLSVMASRKLPAGSSSAFMRCAMDTSTPLPWGLGFQVRV